MTDQYDIRAYNDKELLNILGLVSPSDRELEAKLIEMIRRYSFIRTNAGKKLYKFFTDIYDHFFETPNEGEEDEEEPLEGFTTMGNSNTNDNTNANTNDNSNSNSNSNTNDNNDKEKDEVSLIQQLDYTVGKLNPILKETYKRTISIDSQYRDSEYTMSTDFTLNFTETLRDVVSIKLYAIQLPVTWYTINENYGSNFFYLKSSTPGINTPDHEYRIQVSAGNYSPVTLQTAIAESFTNLRTTYPDVNFGETKIEYNVTDCKSTITMDIQKVYNEHYYEMHFERPASEFGSLAKMLGFQETSYTELYTVYSGDPETNSLDTTTEKRFKIDNNNRKFKIIQYDSQLYTDATFTSKNYDNILLEYDDFQGITSESLLILSNDVSYNPIRIIEISLDTANEVTMTNLLDKVNTKLQTNINLDNVSGVAYDETYDRFVWKIKLNRDIPNINIPNSKTVIIFPYDVSWSDPVTTDSSVTRQLWVDDSDVSYNSGFGFKQTQDASSTNEAVIELSNMYAENQKTTKFAANGLEIRFICIDPSFNPAITTGSDYISNPNFDFTFNITDPENYVQSTFAAAINNALENHLEYSSNLIGTQVFLEDNLFKFKINISRHFDISKFVSGSQGPIQTFGTIFDDFGFKTNNPTDNTDNTYKYISKKGIRTDETSYTIPQGTLFTIQSNKVDTLNDVQFVIDISQSKTFENSITLPAHKVMSNFIRNTIQQYKYDPLSDNCPLRESTFDIDYNTTQSSSLDFALTIKIDFEISEKSYRVDFFDPANGSITDFSNSVWYSAFKIDNSYDLSNYMSVDNSYALITGNSIDLDQLAINETITFKPKQTSNGGVYIQDSSFNDIVIPVNTGTTLKTREQIVDQINEQFYNNELTRGSFLQLDIHNSFSTTKMRLNINKIFTSKDYRLVFYDIYSFVRCNESTRSYKNATIDNTLGWILGFRTLSEYALLQENKFVSTTIGTTFFKNPDTLLSTGSIYSYQETFINGMTESPSNVITTIKGDTTVSVNLYNYFMIILDDFNQNHLNDGLVTVTKRDNSVTLPSYANRKKYTCDPITGEITNTGIPSGQNSLTQNQLYSLNQIISTQNKNRGDINSGPFVKDMFALLPVKTSGMIPGSIFVEYGGTLQNQERVYFGPVNINRMQIKLINDRGDVVDLNGANWSIQLVCEQLYQKQKST